MNAVLFVAFLWMMNAVFLVVHMGFALFCGGNAGSQKGSVVFAILHGKCVVLWFALLNRFIVVPMFARTLISCFLSLLVLQASARLQTKRATEHSTLAERSWSNVLQEVEGTLRADCGDVCVEVLHAYFPPGNLAANMTSNEMLNSSFQTVSKQIALQVPRRQFQNFNACCLSDFPARCRLRRKRHMR